VLGNASALGVWTVRRWVAIGVVLFALVAMTATAPGAAHAAVADQSVASQLDPQHDGNLTSVPLTPPLVQQWSDTFGPTIPSQALVVNGIIYVSASPAGSTSGVQNLYALDEATGATLWSRSDGDGPPAYDAGRVFAVSFSGLLSAFDAVTGTLDWSQQLTGQSFFEAAPVAADGIVYVTGDESGSTLYAIDEQTGTLLWSDPMNGSAETPALDGTNVFLAFPCQYYAVNADTGESAWYDNDGCDGGGGGTPVVADGHVFIRPGFGTDDILDSSTGVTEGPLGTTQTPAVAGGVAYELAGSTLEAISDDGLGTNAWSFAGDGQLTGAPIVTDGVVWIGSSSGNLYAPDPSTGDQLWSTNVGSSVSSLSAGNGALVVSTNDSVVAYAPQPADAVPQNQLAPSVDGSPDDGAQVAADVGVWTNLPTSYSYQWESCSPSTGCADISGTVAKTANYTVQDTDVGSTLKVIVTATNGVGDSTSVTSSPSPVIKPMPPTVTQDPTISGSDVAGGTLSATEGSWTGSPTAFTYQWQDCLNNGNPCTNISGANDPTYTTQPSDVGGYLDVRVTASNAGGTSFAAVASPSAVIVWPSNVAPPTISGQTIDGDTLDVQAGTWTSPPAEYRYRWERCDPSGEGCFEIPGATQQSYTLTDADVGDTIVVEETAVYGSSLGTYVGPASSKPTAVVQGGGVEPSSPPVNLTPPQVSGLPIPGGFVSVAVGQWSPSPLTFAYQWEMCQSTCAPIAGATTSDLQLTTADDGASLEVIVTATDTGGSTAAVSSASGTIATRTEDTATLQKAIGAVAPSATVDAVLHAHGESLAMSRHLVPGTLTVDWYVRNASHKLSLVAAGHAIVRRARQLQLRLTGTGSRLLEHAHGRLQLVAKGQLAGPGYTLTASRRLTLRR
jgi:outer membrane protein assembly factor BamB